MIGFQKECEKSIHNFRMYSKILWRVFIVEENKLLVSEVVF